MALEGMLPHVDVGSGSPVVLLHGFGLDARMWADQVAGLSRRHRVLAPDLPGFGPDGAEHGVARPAEEVFRLLSTKALGPVHLVGLSYGGAVAVDLTLAHPEAVRTLVLVDALLIGERSGIDAWPECVEHAKQNDLAAARAAWLGAALFSRVRARTDLRERTQEMVGAYRCSHWRETLRTVWERPTAKSLLADIRCRTLVLVGEADSPEFKAMANAYAQGIPGATLVEMEGVGHMGPMEAPERFNRLLGDFIEADEAAMPVLPSSTRLEFRTWQRDNLPLGMQLWGDAQVTAFITARPFTPLQVEERVRQEVLGQATYGMQYGPVFLRSSGELVGCCGFRPRPATPGTLELGFLLRPQFWGLGLATEAARAAVEHGFGALGATAVFAGHHPENLGSRRVLEKLGFRRTHLEHYPPTGLDHPSYLLTREAFFSEPPSP
jgi:[ribosomal protein S5]-alanine N-acetyltransferase